VFGNLKIKALLLRFFTRKNTINFDIKNVKKILFFRYDRIGDMIITTPVFRELKLNYPNIKITVLASKSNQSVLLNNPYVDDIFVNHKNNLFGDLLTLIKLRNKNFDACIEFDHSVVPHSIIRLNIIKPKIIISVEKKGRYGVLGTELLLYDFFTKKREGMHFRDIWLDTLSPFGILPNSNDYDLFCTHTQIQKALKFVAKFNKKFLIGINLKGAIEGKKVNYSDLRKICKGLFKYDKNIQVIILTSPVDFKIVCKKIKQKNLENVEISYKTDTILDVAALINQMDLIITPDTSVTHIASAFNKPIITIHENNLDSYKLFAPISDQNRTIFSKSRTSLNGFSTDQLLKYSQELIEHIKDRKNSLSVPPNL
jgi:ADP-heptose:LPS heptosyltransferase